MEILKKLVLTIFLIVMCIFLCISGLENGLLLSVISILTIIFFVKKIKIKRFSIFLIIVAFISKLVVVVVLDVPILADYKVMYEASTRAVNGDFSFITEGYFLAYAYQLGHVFYQFLVLKVINNIIVLKILNCIFATVITWLIYKILKRFVKEDTARITSLIYAISLYPMYLNAVLGNQQLGMMLFLLGIYVLITKKNTILNGIIVGTLFALGNLERPEGIIYITTLIVYNILTFKNIKEIIKEIIPAVVTYLILGQIFSFILIQNTDNEIGLKGDDPYWKFLIGFNYEYSGKNNIEDYNYTTDREAEKQEVISRITDIKKLPMLFYNKIKIQWLYDDLETTFNATNTTQFTQKVVKTIVVYIKTINLIVIAFVLVGVLKNKNMQSTNYFFIINILIYFAVYLLIEVSARYYYNPQVSVIILSGLGIERTMEFVKTKFSEKKNLKEEKI